MARKTDRFSDLKQSLGTKTSSSAATKKCTCCEEDKKFNEYYKVFSPLFKDDLFPTCKMCIKDLVDTSSSLSIYDMLRRMDRPFIVEKWDEVKEKSPESDSLFGLYLKSISAVTQLSLTWEDSMFPDDDDAENIADLNRRWSGFTYTEKMILEEMYQEMLGSYDSSSPIQRDIYKNICVARHKSNIAIAKNNSTDFERFRKVISSLMNDAKIKPVQETGFDENSTATFGQFIEKVENERPIPEATGEFKDADGIKKYINKWFTKQMQRALDLRTKNDDIEEKIKDGES
ncbi:hypothetical protein [Exiguobacterium sp. s133]|uniref:hypothetical protein n=1 Tax=Exiguobacterium sp. s133 TaxID=2751213 RepID=UPI001BEC5C67|nr:hypothetical protein [Exiguobacterium sp. s133]